MNITENINRHGFYYDNTQNAIGGNTRRHYHENCELYFLEKGTCNYFVDNRYYMLREGDLIFIPNNRIHQTNYNKDIHSRKLINCSTEYIPTDIFNSVATESLVFRNPSTVREISEIFKLIEKEYLIQDKYSDRLIRNHINRLFYFITRHKGESTVLLAENKTVRNVVEYIRKNYMHEISLSEIAEKSAISAEHLSRVFKKEIGVGFNEYINTVRLQRAEFMLKNEDGKSVSEVAFACGFNDSNYFSYKFKKLYGVSPISLKRKIAENHDGGYELM